MEVVVIQQKKVSMRALAQIIVNANLQKRSMTVILTGKKDLLGAKADGVNERKAIQKKHLVSASETVLQWAGKVRKKPKNELKKRFYNDLNDYLGCCDNLPLYKVV